MKAIMIIVVEVGAPDRGPWVALGSPHPSLNGALSVLVYDGSTRMYSGGEWRLLGRYGRSDIVDQSTGRLVPAEVVVLGPPGDGG
jgi:hypothetical protein